VVEVRATLELFEPPRVAERWVWALQVSCGAGGAAHLGLQWHPSYPGSTAANFGGYARGGGELGGGPLAHRSALDNANTCDYPWLAGEPYRLAVRARGQGRWVGAIDDEPLRELRCDDRGAGLVSPMVWTECFARCDAPPATVRWSDLAVRTASGAVVPVEAVRVSYQSPADGGCGTGRIDEVEPGVWLQSTGVPR
jgi:hypothetical protein